MEGRNGDAGETTCLLAPLAVRAAQRSVTVVMDSCEARRARRLKSATAEQPPPNPMSVTPAVFNLGMFGPGQPGCDWPGCLRFEGHRRRRGWFALSWGTGASASEFGRLHQSRTGTWLMAWDGPSSFHSPRRRLLA